MDPVFTLFDCWSIFGGVSTPTAVIHVGQVSGFARLSGVDVNGTPYVEGGRLLTARPTTLTRMGIAFHITHMGRTERRWGW
jgi:hypothetical protein